MERKTLVVRILAMIALVCTVHAAIGWVVFLGGFGFLATKRPTLHQKMLNPVFTCTSLTGETTWPWVITNITGPCWDPYWVVSVLSPILFIVLTVKSILLIVKDELFRKLFVFHILAVIAFILTVITLCFMGYLMVQMRATILGIVRPNPVLISPTVPGYIDALFAGIVLETMFLSVAWICHILAFLFGGMMESPKV